MSDTKIIKLMTLSRAQFDNSFKQFKPDYRGSMATSKFVLEAGSGSVTIEIEMLPDKVFTKLMSLPQAQVTLTLRNMSSDEQDHFLDRFDISFRRGGG